MFVMFRTIFFGFIFILHSHDGKINAEKYLYNEASGRIRPLSTDQKLFRIEGAGELTRAHDRSSTFMQSRRFHFDQMIRDNRDLGQRTSHLLSTRVNSGISLNVIGSNPEGCRLRNNYCSRDQQCCSGKCRCVRWSVMGKMSCWKKCF